MKSQPIPTDHYDLCVVGAGIAGLNALFSATQYLESSSKVLLLDRNDRPGGMWCHVYDYVRLHQPHQFFTAGDISWETDKPPEYLATKHEVLDHLAHCLDVVSRRVRLDIRFGTSFESAVEADGIVGVRHRDAAGTAVTVRVDRLIKAIGTDVQALDPLPLSSPAVRSVTPNMCDVRELPDDGAPVWIIGSGKTAMDTAVALLRTDRSRSVNMIAGSGTWFGDRDLLYPTGRRRWSCPRSNQIFVEIARRFDGTNEDIAKDYGLRTFGIQVTEGTGNYLAGLLSHAERDLVVDGLTAVIPGHLEDVVDRDGVPTAIIDGDDSVALSAGSWIINCTGHFRNHDEKEDEPYTSPSGAVVSMNVRSWTTHFASFAGYYLPHLAYRGKLTEVPLYALDLLDLYRKEPHVVLYAMSTLAIHNLGLLSDALPPKVFSECGLDFDRWVPLPRRMIGMAAFLAAKRRDRAHHRKTLDTIAQRFDVRCAPLPYIDATHRVLS